MDEEEAPDACQANSSRRRKMFDDPLLGRMLDDVKTCVDVPSKCWWLRRKRVNEVTDMAHVTVPDVTAKKQRVREVEGGPLAEAPGLSGGESESAAGAQEEGE